jgi:hypothetical protein
MNASSASFTKGPESGWVLEIPKVLALLSSAPRRLAGRLREATSRIVVRLHRAIWLKKVGWVIQIMRLENEGFEVAFVGYQTKGNASV